MRPPRTSGPALVILKSGYSYVADVHVVDGLVHGSNVRQKIGHSRDMYLRSVPDRFWPPNQIIEVRWDDPATTLARRTR